MPRRVMNRTFSVDDQTEADIRRFAIEMGVSQSELLREAVRLLKVLTTAVEAMGPDRLSPHRARRIALVPDGYRLPRELREAIIAVPLLPPAATPTVELMEVQNGRVTIDHDYEG